MIFLGKNRQLSEGRAKSEAVRTSTESARQASGWSNKPNCSVTLVCRLIPILRLECLDHGFSHINRYADCI